jgi:hypothetical protein
MLPNDSVTVTPGSGATVATHSVSSKEYQVFMEADSNGHLIGSRPGFLAWYTAATNASGRSVADLFNADASLLVKVRGIWIVPTLTAITGAQISFDVNKTSAVGTGGTAVTPRKLDSADAALDTDITARWGATGGNTLDHLYFTVYAFNEETNASIGLLAYQNQLPTMGDRVVEIVLRQNQGIQIKQSNATAVGLTGALIYFVVE